MNRARENLHLESNGHRWKDLCLCNCIFIYLHKRVLSKQAIQTTNTHNIKIIELNLEKKIFPKFIDHQIG